MFKSKPNSLSPAPSGPNSIQTKLPFSFSSPLKSAMIGSRLNVGSTVHTSHLNPFPEAPSPIPEASASLSTLRDQATHTCVSRSVRRVPWPRCNPFGCQQTQRGVMRDKRIAQGETRKRTAGEKVQKLKGRQMCASVVFQWLEVCVYAVKGVRRSATSEANQTSTHANARWSLWKDSKSINSLYIPHV